MSDVGKLIADALAEIGEQATRPRLRSDAAWRAGRRRRLRSRAASAAGAAGVAAAAAVLPLTLTGGPSRPGPGPAAGAPVLLATPIQVRQIAAIAPSGPGHCRVTPRQVPDASGKLCFRLTKTGMTVLGVESIRVKPDAAGGSMLLIRLTPADSKAFGRLTRRLAGLPAPRHLLAFIVRDRVVFQPTVQGAVTSGNVELVSGISQARAEHLLAELAGH
jgi:hypothetical protein